MKIFNLPDLGEGLPDAEIVEWLVAEGDEVELDDPLVSMETAKAVVEVPSPFTGRVAKLYGQAGDVIETGKPLAGFDVEGEADDDEPPAEPEPAAEPEETEAV
ncbi:MAG: dihydrolipoyllysine-residue (2-methylpropanoyl)transferase, partial [Xanthomonadales bacterium]|nr:dihydrolipoyllysine-residue (2-methylpropanoyl)transferase [Xanthomonadales bacterium]NIX12639.1 dihydrolipoyllysine-residue (2-methylpropanoyl)transferase [Xanthomonadales bacterium]